MMTKAATVVRHNDELARGVRQGLRAGRAGQALLAVGHRQLDEPKRGLHQGAARHVPAGQGDPARGARSATNAAAPTSSPSSPCPASRRPIRPSGAGRPKRGATASRRTRRNGSRRTIATCTPDGEPVLTYEEVDTSLIPPRPRLYGLVGAEVIEEVWKERQAAKSAAAHRQKPVRRRKPAATPKPAVVH